MSVLKCSGEKLLYGYLSKPRGGKNYDSDKLCANVNARESCGACGKLRAFTEGEQHLIERNYS